ncbi:1-acyl-sn-glycerol-3-phosphate acyltransferases [Lishizhenia tianjinensis]|uniref:1-acyl-sn-glycerol-3-phosphate acyltransferases n=1 Tax=Lishizhenia tianjinensis TaxID=477690 RepID=A0A1I7AQD4_9FLAO|nr:1-acyl-sn-glycerol-3-phosphate acyltransferase [Lishizhenia tianjinensis]SFT77179.1 1-acyl-sn-glycerol-3-phosphate acyltransferases [Lishizhenia tianjinensis]
MIYRILKFLIGIGIRLYYKEIKINEKKYLNTEGPLIIIANHPNTLMDAWVMGMISKKPIYYMAKATLFDSKFKLRLLRSLNMIPINRQGEGTTRGVDNTQSFEECYKRLEEGKTLVIFPEGTSYKERVLRNLKTGTARIALETEKRNEGKLNLKVVAVGLNYSQPEKFRSKILVNIDEPKAVKPYLEEYLKNPSGASKKLTENFRARLEKVLVTTQNKEEDELVEDLHKILNSKYIKQKEKGVKAEVNHLKDITESLIEINLSEPWLIQEIQSKVDGIKWRLDKMQIRADFLDRRFRSTMFFRQVLLAVMFIVLAIPVFIFGLIHNILQYLLTDWIIPKLSKDIEYYAPFAVFLGLFFYPVTYGLFTYFAVTQFHLNWVEALFYFASLPLSGIFAYWFARYLKHISYKWQYMLIMMDKKHALDDLKKERDELRKLIFSEA